MIIKGIITLAVLIFLLLMWDRITSSILGVVTFLVTIAIIFWGLFASH